MITSNEIQRILDSKKIGQSTAPEMMSTLVKVYMLIGLRQQNYPSDVETKMICSYMLTNYPLKTLDELYLAFDLAVKDQLEYDLKVYDAFTIPILNGVMAGYKKWLYLESQKVQKPVALPPITVVTISEKVQECDEWEQKSNVKMLFIPLYLYDYLTECGRLNLTKEEKLSYMDKAKKYRLSKLESESQEDRSLRQEFKNLSELLKENNLIGEELERLKNLAKKIAVYEYLNNKKSS